MPLREQAEIPCCLVADLKHVQIRWVLGAGRHTIQNTASRFYRCLMRDVRQKYMSSRVGRADPQMWYGVKADEVDLGKAQAGQTV